MNIVVGALKTRSGTIAIQRSVEEARRVGGTIHLVAHVEPPIDSPQVDQYSVDIERAERDARGWIPDFVPPDVSWELHVPLGMSRPADAIILVAHQVKADLIVVGRRSRTRVGKALLGSNVRDIIMGSPCEVLAVPVEAD